jgi:threonine dehydrogenase-like Zn-dependent dehydrogenase
MKLPPEVNQTHAALFGMAGVATHDVPREETRLGDRVLLVGAGAIGQLTAQAARGAGAHVTVVDVNHKAAPIDDRVLGFVLIGKALKMLLEQNLEDVNPARLVHPLGDRGERKG